MRESAAWKAFDGTSESGLRVGYTVSGAGEFHGTDWKIEVKKSKTEGTGPVFTMRDSTRKVNFRANLRLLQNSLLMTEGQTDETFQDALTELRGTVSLEILAPCGKKTKIDYDVFGKNRKSAGTASFTFIPATTKIPAGVYVTADRIVGRIPLTKIQQYIDVKKGVQVLFGKIDGQKKIWLEETQDAVSESLATGAVSGTLFVESLVTTIGSALQFAHPGDGDVDMAC
uniref:Uncharacterized protein n=1 Tax=viral metagenome TaxID=1070528 RepID=A0A6C0KR30_9ZZZZ